MLGALATCANWVSHQTPGTKPSLSLSRVFVFLFFCFCFCFFASGLIYFTPMTHILLSLFSFFSLSLSLFHAPLIPEYHDYRFDFFIFIFSFSFFSFFISMFVNRQRQRRRRKVPRDGGRAAAGALEAQSHRRRGGLAALCGAGHPWGASPRPTPLKAQDPHKVESLLGFVSLRCHGCKSLSIEW